jgi:hypothetical protein
MIAGLEEEAHDRTSADLRIVRFDRDRVRDDLQRLDWVLARLVNRLELVVRIRVAHTRHRSERLVWRSAAAQRGA